MQAVCTAALTTAALTSLHQRPTGLTVASGRVEKVVLSTGDALEGGGAVLTMGHQITARHTAPFGSHVVTRDAGEALLGGAGVTE